MPREIIVAPAFTKIRSDAEYNKYGAIAQGVQGFTDTIAQALLTYSAHHDQEQREKLAFLGTMVSQYKDRTPQPVMEEFDRIAKQRYGFGLPKDPATGAFMTPSPSLRDKVEREIAEDPKALHDFTVKTATGMSPIQQHLKQEEVDAKVQHNAAMEAAAQTRAHASMLMAGAAERRASAAERKAEAESSSDMVRLPSGRVTSYSEATNGGTENIPQGTTLLTRQAAKDALANQAKQDDLELKKKRLHLDSLKITSAFTSGSQRVLFGAMKDYFAIDKDGKPKMSAEGRKALKPILATAMEHAGADPESIKTFMAEGVNKKNEASIWSLWHWFGDPQNKPVIDAMTNDAQAEMQHPIAPIAPDLKPGSEFPGVPGLKYEGKDE